MLYFDTDSVIYIVKLGHLDIPLGDYLGEMTDELDDDDFILEFTSAALKITSTKPVKLKCVAK